MRMRTPQMTVTMAPMISKTMGPVPMTRFMRRLATTSITPVTIRAMPPSMAMVMPPMRGWMRNMMPTITSRMPMNSDEAPRRALPRSKNVVMRVIPLARKQMPATAATTASEMAGHVMHATPASVTKTPRATNHHL